MNWEEVALHFLRGVQADAVADGMPETARLLERLTAYPGIPALATHTLMTTLADRERLARDVLAHADALATVPA